MADPILDFRDFDAFYAQAVSLAQSYCRDWTQYWPADLEAAVPSDPGLVMLKLFALLAQYTAEMENGIPHQRRLALYQFLAQPLRPPVQARAALSFVLRQDQPPRLVPAESAVVNSPGQTIRFQTDRDLEVLPATITTAMTVLPTQDQYVDAQALLSAGLPAPLFVAAESDPAEQDLPHWFLMGDGQLFKPDEALDRLTVELSGAQLHPDLFAQWTDGALTPLKTQVQASPDHSRLTVTFDTLPRAAPRSLGQVQAALYAQGGLPAATMDAPTPGDDDASLYWLLVHPGPLVRVVHALSRQLPVITGATCTLGGDGIVPQQAADGTVLLNIANGVYPFGQTPAVNDAFYLRSDAIFARQGARVTLSLVLRPVGASYPVEVQWQYWNDGQWTPFNATPADCSLYQFVDDTNALRGQPDQPQGRISFLCPAMTPTTVAGESGLWIRCVLVQGGYGSMGGIVTQPVTAAIDAIDPSILTPEQKAAVSTYLNTVEGINFSYSVVPSSYAPPYIAQAGLGYEYTARPGQFSTYNNFVPSRFLFRPYKPVTLNEAAFFLGFSPAGLAQYGPGRTLTLFFHLTDETTASGPALSWWSFDGAAWQPLEVDDGTDGLNRSGIVSFTIPATWGPASLFSQTALWLRIDDRRPGSKARRSVRAWSITPNGVMAGNRTSVPEDVLGSSTERPSQSFLLSCKPVLAGAVVTVLEPRGMAPADRAGAQTERSQALFTAATPAGGDTDEGAADAQPVARVWRQVDTFADCGPGDRVYTLDSATGLIVFGDGRNGMIPPAGHNNIVAAYDTTQGLAGNVPAGSLTILKPAIADIAAVTNPAPALGGVDGDDVAQVDRSGPATLKANDRAVQAGDIATLAEAASPQICRARAVVQPDRTIRLALLARSAEPRPHAGPALLTAAQAHVRQRCLAPLAGRITAVNADFAAVDVMAQVRSDCAADQRVRLQQDLAAQLAAFLQPVLGGPHGLGWNFGEAVTAAAIARALRRHPLVRGIAALTVNGIDDGAVVPAPGQVAAAGAITVLVYGE